MQKTKNKEGKKLVAEIIPAIKLPRRAACVFSYEVPKRFEKEIKTGAVVKILFRKRLIAGVVRKLKKEEKRNTKYKLKSVLCAARYTNLSREQMKLAQYISDYYYVSLSSVVKSIIPSASGNEPRKDIELNNSCEIPNIESKKIDTLLKKIHKKKKVLLIHNLMSSRHNLYLKIIKESIKPLEQALVLLPEFFDIYNFANFYLKNINKEKTAIITSSLTRTQHFKEWRKVADNKVKIVLGTRQAVFAPFRNLKLIIVDEEHNPSYKQWDQNPRYHAVNAAKKLSACWKSRIILSSHAPSVENYYKGEKEKFFKVEFYEDDHKKKKFEVIDMATEREKGNYSIFSESLRNGLLNSVYKKQQAVIFIPRLGEKTSAICKDCEHILKCGDCDSNLAVRKDRLYCLRCKGNTEKTEKCPRCQGQNIKLFGYGSQRIEKETNKLFTNKNIKTSRLDSNSASSKAKQMKIYKNFINKNIDILIGTQMVLKNWNLKNISVFAVLFPEIIFNQPDFRSKERSFQLLMSLYNRTSQRQRIIIQTLNPDSVVFKLIKSGEFNSFYSEELKNRRDSFKIGYPPFSQIIKLVYKNQSIQNCENEARKMHGILKSKINSSVKLKGKFEITSPFPALNYKEHGKYRWHIIIKSVCCNMKLRNQFLNNVKKSWIVDIDPSSVV